jgi:hypothetical protein
VKQRPLVTHVEQLCCRTEMLCCRITTADYLISARLATVSGQFFAVNRMLSGGSAVEKIERRRIFVQRRRALKDSSWPAESQNA